MARIGLCVCIAMGTGQAAQKAQFTQIEHEFNELRNVLKIPGISVAILQDQKVVWAKGLGFADLEHHRRATENTLYPKTQELAWTRARTNAGSEIPYGLGWFVQDYEGTKLVWHYGQWPIFAGLILKVPARNMTLILLANNTGLNAPFPLAEEGNVLASPFALAFLRTFVDGATLNHAPKAPEWRLDAGKFSSSLARLQERNHGYNYAYEGKTHTYMMSYLQTRAARVRKEVNPNSGILDSHVGKYALNAKERVIISRNPGGLMIEYPGQAQGNLFAESDSQFFMKIANTQVSFFRDNNGHVARLLLHSNDKDREAIKTE